MIDWLSGHQLVTKFICVYQLRFQKDQDLKNEFIWSWPHCLYWAVNPPVWSKAEQEFNAKKYITFWVLRNVMVQGKVRNTPLLSPQSSNVWSVFPFAATLPSSSEECPGSLRIKWISCLEHSPTLAAMTRKGRQMNDSIDRLLCRRSRKNRSFLPYLSSFWFLFVQFFLSAFLLHCCWGLFLWLF